MRADARRNRDCIVAAALELFRARGTGVSMDEIAREARVGVGTLYRHFPDRQALVDEIATSAMRELLDFSRDAAATDLSRWQVFLEIVRKCTELPLAMLKSLREENPDSVDLSELKQAQEAVFLRLFAEAQREGSMRPDVPADEVLSVLNVMVCRPGARAGDHLVTVMLDGLRAGPVVDGDAGVEQPARRQPEHRVERAAQV
ncbi:TetR/AcrR family transcriptional regulator [Pseudonocardia spinosispora]|uniref:TetR/AcrR family transcriptional regulator n=1 Tax=Pseudonocardia spinosispora TaxID=103441 RepID=UPI0007E8CF85|nr:TetR/AcrR family transcriptional regulator [Pseudonocardia spinosispora]